MRLLREEDHRRSSRQRSGPVSGPRSQMPHEGRAASPQLPGSKGQTNMSDFSRRGLSVFGMAWSGRARLGAANTSSISNGGREFGAARPALARNGAAGHGTAQPAEEGRGRARLASVWRGTPRPGTANTSPLSNDGRQISKGRARLGSVRHAWVWQGVAWQGGARLTHSPSATVG